MTETEAGSPGQEVLARCRGTLSGNRPTMVQV